MWQRCQVRCLKLNCLFWARPYYITWQRRSLLLLLPINGHNQRVHHSATSQGSTNHHHHHHYHQSLNCEGRWGTTDDFATRFLHFSLFSIALWDLPNSRPVHSLILSSHLFLCLPCLLPPFTVPCKMVLARPDEWETWPYHCSLHLFTIRSSGGLRVVQLPAGFWHVLPHR